MTELLGTYKAEFLIGTLYGKRATVSKFLEEKADLLATAINRLARMTEEQAEKYIKSAIGKGINNNPFLLFCLACPLYRACPYPRDPRVSTPFQVKMCYGCSRFVTIDDTKTEGIVLFSQGEWPYTGCRAFRPKKLKDFICKHPVIHRVYVDNFIKSHGDLPSLPLILVYPVLQKTLPQQNPAFGAFGDI